VYLLAISIAAIGFFIIALQLVYLALQFGGSLLSGRKKDERLPHQARCAVIIPAHNESGGIAAAVGAIKSQLNPSDRLVVVADNCSDDTALLAAALGAEVIERTDPVRVGKGYALDFGIKHITAGAAPDVIVFVDADCIAAPGCISRIVNLANDTGRPAQGKYLMHASIETAATRMSEFTYRIKNDIRPTGGARLGLPCLLHGTAMAIPSNLLSRSSLATGNITEDLKLAIDLSMLGFPALFCPDARCDSSFPESENGMNTQQTRWQHGYFSCLIEFMPRLLLRALGSADWRLFAIAIDLSIPPLSLMLVITASISAVAGVAIWLGASSILAKAAVTLAPVFVFLILIAWFFHGRDLISVMDLVRSLNYITTRVSMLWSFIARPQKNWVRTERKDDR
jgi:cellulose synthase/poly-beta-1,6-N-acetylglucosamine synthase-like glycosyltransferase